jgi:two-component system, chemotaxis family, chemotaxis protein CheY
MVNMLAVDDDEKISEGLHVLVRSKGHQVMIASHSQTGFKWLRREQPHVMTLECESPDIDGLAVLRKIRAVDPQTPVIRLTGAGSDEQEQQACEVRLTASLAKGYPRHARGAVWNLVLHPPIKTGARALAMPEEHHSHPFNLNTFSGGGRNAK